MPASRTRLVSIGLDLAPTVAIDVKNMHIIHPLHTVIAPEIVYF
jgi:hypothetical protein